MTISTIRYIIISMSLKVLKESLDPSTLKKLKKNLTVKPLMQLYENENTEFPVYKESDTSIIVPKFFYVHEGLEAPDNVPVSERIGTDAHLQFSGTLRPDQETFVKEILSTLEQKDSCILCAGTGQGKTSMALYIATIIKKKTLIIVHKEFLLNQWIERIKQFIPGTSVGTIRGPTIDINHSIVIGLIQSISMKDYDSTVFDSFGLVIIDETHHICSKTFSKALFKTGTKKMLGLTATPNRADGLTKVLNWFLGSIISKEKKNTEVKPSILIVEAKYKDPIQVLYDHAGRIKYPDFISKLIKDPVRNNLIVDLIKKYLAENRKILILSDRRGHCTSIKKMLEETLNHKYTIGLYIGQMKQEQLDLSNKCDVILATYNMASEGYDNVLLDTLIMATGKSNIEQSIGRILRQKNKNKPLIIDIADSKYRYNQFLIRKRYYKKNNFNVSYGSGDTGPEAKDPEDTTVLEKSAFIDDA